MKWKHFPRHWPFVRGIHRPPLNSPHKGQWRGALMLSLISFWINRWVNNRKTGDLRRHRAHYEVTVMMIHSSPQTPPIKMGMDACRGNEPLLIQTVVWTARLGNQDKYKHINLTYMLEIPDSSYQNIEAKTKLPPFCKWHIQTDFLERTLWISNEIPSKYIPWGPIDHISALVQIMAWRQIDAKPLSDPITT